MASQVRIAIDIGGTFTDGVLVHPDGRLVTAKVLSTPDDPSRGFFHAVETLMATAGVESSSVSAIGHATTVATNAIIEGNLKSMAMVTTAGFRDVLEIARQNRPYLYDFFCEKPRPLVPRHLVYEVRERVRANGTVDLALDVEQAEQIVREIGRQDVSSVVICLLHAYANPDHERQIERLVERIAPGLRVARSSAISPRIGEYARACTSALNAGLLPIVGEYAERIQAGLHRRGLGCPVWVMQSSGGAMGLETAASHPVTMIESGPAAGIQAAAEIGRHLHVPNLLSLDMGGTTTKAAVILDHRPLVITDYEVGAYGSGSARAERGRGYPINSPVIDVVEVGTGGGSIAWIDNGGRFRVGPTSAGASPGPACYGLDGRRPTVTDANVLLGRIPIAEPLGGEIVLRRDLAADAINREIAQPLGMDLVTAALGVLDIAEAAMARALFSVTVDRGHDPADFTLMAFGGAAPLHACAVAEHVGVSRVIVPPVPGVFSALGVVLADVRMDTVETHLAPLDRTALDSVGAHFARLSAQVAAAVEREGVPRAEIDIELGLEMRYRGQSGLLAMRSDALQAESDLDPIRARFAELHRMTFGFADQDDPIEIVNLRATATARRAARPSMSVARREDAPPETTIESVVDRARGAEPVRLIWRDALPADQAVPGPALILEAGSTTLVRPGWLATSRDDCLMLVRTTDGASIESQARSRGSRVASGGEAPTP
jgi:N-methylhydantoinase A